MLENREAIRFECDEALICKSKSKEFGARVLDVSRGGMRVQSKKQLKVGSKVVLRLENKARGRAAVNAVVRWVGRGEMNEMGLEFQDSASKLSKRWVRKLFPESGSSSWVASKQQRAEIRAKARVPVVSSSGTVEGATKDLSRSGASLELSGKLEEGSGLIFCLPSSYLEVQADIVRVEQEGDQWIHSVKLSELSPEQKRQLEAFVQDRTASVAFEQHSKLPVGTRTRNWIP